MPETELKNKLITMMKWFHDFCIQNGIRYYAIGGTLLGAMRHDGFIPWDDDMDIGVPRREYNTLIEISKSKQLGQYVFESPYSNTQDYKFPYIKLYDTMTTLYEGSKTKIKRGIFIDIFPLDGIGNTKTEIKKNYRKINFLRFINNTKNCTPEISKKKTVRAAKYLLGPFLHFINNKRLHIIMDLACRRFDFDECTYVGNLLGRYKEREIVTRDVFGTPTPHIFETIELNCVENYDAYLASIYGEWRKTPPKEQQTTIHNYISIDLNKSYL